MIMALLILALIGLVMWGMYEDVCLLIEEIEIGAGGPVETDLPPVSGLTATLTPPRSAAGTDTPYDWAAEA